MFDFIDPYERTKLWFEPTLITKLYTTLYRVIFVVVSLVIYVMTKLGVTLFAGALLFKVTTGISIYIAVPIIVILTCVYTAVGGLTAVMYTDMIQLCIFVGGGLVGTIVSLNLTGGSFKSLFAIFDSRNLNHFTHMVRHETDPNFPLVGMLIANIINCLWFFCIDQELA